MGGHYRGLDPGRADRGPSLPRQGVSTWRGVQGSPRCGTRSSRDVGGAGILCGQRELSSLVEDRMSAQPAGDVARRGWDWLLRAAPMGRGCAAGPACCASTDAAPTHTSPPRRTQAASAALTGQAGTAVWPIVGSFLRLFSRRGFFVFVLFQKVIRKEGRPHGHLAWPLLPSSLSPGR